MAAAIPLFLSVLAQSFGVLTLLWYVFRALLDGSLILQPPEKAKNDLAVARNKIWNLALTPADGLTHAFFSLRNGKTLHYIGPDRPVRDPNKLVILVHGFPDSYHLWSKLLKAPAFRRQGIHDNVVVALDLPGYGGSEGTYENDGATGVLEALAEFIIGMRRMFFSNTKGARGKVIYVGHDWGCIVGFRLAAEAPALADRFILSNAPHPPMIAAKAKKTVATSSRMLTTFIRHPISCYAFCLTAFANMSPIIGQAKRSRYTFVFNLPLPLASLAGSMGNFWFLRDCHYLVHGKDHPLESKDAAEAMASSLGPGLEECKTRTLNGEAYPTSIAQRAKSGGWVEKIAYYRNGVFAKRWRKSDDTLKDLNHVAQSDVHMSSGDRVPPNRPPGALGAPVTVIWGQKDPVLDRALCLDGIEDYLVQGSQVVLLPRTGHWSPMEQESGNVFEKVLEWAMGSEKQDLEGMVREVYDDAVVSVQR